MPDAGETPMPEGRGARMEALDCGAPEGGAPRVRGLSVDGISVRYGQHLALEGASIRVGPGECVVILGANGAGKSSLLRGLTGLTGREPGARLRWNGADIAAAAPESLVERGIAHVPEGRGVFTALSVEDNLALGAMPARAQDGAAARREKVFSLFPKLAERRRQRAGTMSGGEQQMVGIARALMSNPDLLLLDEPSLGLAPIVVGEMFDALARIRDEGMAILLVEQNVDESLALAARGYVLEAGRIVAKGESAALRGDPAVARAFLGG